MSTVSANQEQWEFAGADGVFQAIGPEPDTTKGFPRTWRVFGPLGHESTCIIHSSPENSCGMRVLPVARLNGGAYFVDLWLRQFRETMNPGSYVDFDSVKGCEMCRQAGVVTCLQCGFSVIVSAAFDGEGLRCMRYGGVVGC